MKIVVDPTKCLATGACIKACPVGAITIVNGTATIDMDRCDHDGICIPACPQEAISLED